MELLTRLIKDKISLIKMRSGKGFLIIVTIDRLGKDF